MVGNKKLSLRQYIAHNSYVQNLKVVAYLPAKFNEFCYLCAVIKGLCV